MNIYNFIIEGKEGESTFFQSIVISAHSSDQAKIIMSSSVKDLDLGEFKIDEIEELGNDQSVRLVKIIEVSGRSYFGES